MLDFEIVKAMQERETATRPAAQTSDTFHAFSPQHVAPERFEVFSPVGTRTERLQVGMLAGDYG